MSFFADRRPCGTCGKSYDVRRQDGKLRAHMIATLKGQKRCPGGHVPASDWYALATDEDLRAMDGQRFEKAEERTFEPGEPIAEGWSRCGGCGEPSADCSCYLADPMSRAVDARAAMG